MTSAGLMRFLYTMNILLPGGLAILHLGYPEVAALQLWGGSKPSLALPMLGGWWAAVVLVSLLGLSQPLKYSPVMLMQIIYKVAYLGSTILPLVLQGRWDAFPTLPTAVFAAYLPMLLICAPWGYWMGGEAGGRTTAASKKAE